VTFLSESSKVNNVNKNRWVLLFLVLVLIGTIWYTRKNVEIKPFTQSEEIPATTAVVTPPSNDETTKPVATTNSNEEAFCKIIKANADVPLGGKLKIWTSNYQVDEDNTPGTVTLIQSSECPDGLFSKVRIDNLGRLKEVIDCRSTTKENLLAKSGIQGNIEDRMSDGHEFNLAISGYGYFVLECSDGVYLTRVGNFYWDGLQVTSGYCRVLAKDGQYFSWNKEDLDENGCTTDGSCIALVEPDPESIRYFNRTMFATERDPLTRPATHAKVMNNSVEKFEQDGPMGPDWNKLSLFIPPKCDEK